MRAAARAAPCASFSDALSFSGCNLTPAAQAAPSQRPIAAFAVAAPNGTTFTRVGSEPVLGVPSGGWDAGAVPKSPSVVVTADGSVRLFYEANGAVGEAVSSDIGVGAAVAGGSKQVATAGQKGRTCAARSPDSSPFGGGAGRDH